jgi:hypothetical protein
MTASRGCWIFGSGTVSTRTSPFPCQHNARMNRSTKMPLPTGQREKRSTEKRSRRRVRLYPWRRGRLNVVSSAARPCGPHSIECSFLKIVTSFARMTVEVLGNDITDLAKARGRRNADVLAEVMKSFQYSETHACIEGLQLARPLQRFLATRGDGLSLIIDRVLCKSGGRKPSHPDHDEKVNGPAFDH